jgi:hypothetical protein
MAEDLILMEQGDRLVPLEATPYDAERVLRDLLDVHPELLAGAQMDPSNPRRFIQVRREAPSGEWSLDHLFLDQDGVPTLVEVARPLDEESRREVVGRMLDHAANVGRLWPVDVLRALFERQVPAGQPAEGPRRLAALLGLGGDPEELWQRAARNLRQRTLRLVLVADAIADELRAIIEFLDRRMADVEFYGVEVRQYTGEGGPRCYVPRLVGKVPAEPPAREAAAGETPAVAAAAPAEPAAEVVPEPAEAAAQGLSTLQGPAEPEPEEQASPAAQAEPESEVHQLQERLRSLADEAGLEAEGSGESLSVTDRMGTVVALDGRQGTMQFWLAPVQEANPFEVTRIKNDLARVARKALVDRYPSLSAHEALTNWEAVVDILDRLIEVRARTGQPPTSLPATSPGWSVANEAAPPVLPPPPPRPPDQGA